MTQIDLDTLFRKACRDEFGWVEDDLGLRIEEGTQLDRLSYSDVRCRLIVGRILRISEPNRRIDALLVDLKSGADEDLPPNLSERSVRVGRIAQLRRPEMSSAELRRRYSGKNYWADTDDQVRSAVGQVSLDLRELLTRELIHSDEFWDGLVAFGINNLMSLTSDTARADAIEAFEKRDFARAIEIYERVPGALSGADKKRIEISKRHLSS